MEMFNRICNRFVVQFSSCNYAGGVLGSRDQTSIKRALESLYRISAWSLYFRASVLFCGSPLLPKQGTCTADVERQ